MTLTERIRARIERTRANLEKAHANYQAIANGEHGDTIDRTWVNALRARGETEDAIANRVEARRARFARLVAECKPAESAGLAAHVARVVTFYVEALIPDTRLRELVLEHPMLVERWPLDVGERTPWPPEVSLVDATALLERMPDNAAAAIAETMRKGHSLSYVVGTDGTPSYLPSVPHDAAINPATHTAVVAAGRAAAEAYSQPRVFDHPAGYRWEPRVFDHPAGYRWELRAVATLALVERLVLEASALYRARRTVALVRERYTDTLEGLVDDALEREKVDDRATAKPALAGALRVSLDKLAAKLSERPLATEEDARALEGGVLWLDELFAAHVERTGEQGKLEAADTRAKSTERVERGAWPEAFERWDRARPLSLAVALWRDEAGPRLEEARRKPASLARVVAVNVLDLYSRQYEPSRIRNGQQALMFPEQRGCVLVPSLYDGTLASILERGVELLASETGIDLLEWEVTEAHRQYIEQPSDFRHLSIEGGWSALAHEKLELTSRKAPEMVRAIVLAQAHLRFESTGFRGNLLTYSEPRKHAPWQRSRVTITLGDMLLPGFTHALREQLGSATLGAREAGRLVPVLGKTALVGRRNDYAAQRRMVWLFAIAMRDHAEDIAQYGHVSMPLEAWTTLANEAGLPRSSKLLADVMRAWETGSDGAEPLIVRVPGERDRFTLHESRRPALDFIVEGGQRSTKRRAEGKAGAAKRASEHRRTVQKPR